MGHVQVRAATADDAPALLGVIHGAFEEYRGCLNPPSGAHRETLASVKSKLVDEHAFVALWDDEIVGCVFVTAEADHCVLHRLAVLPGFRGRGIAHELIDQVEALAIVSKKLRVRLNVRTELDANRALYERAGYRVHAQGYHAGYTQPTFVVMEKELAGST